MHLDSVSAKSRDRLRWIIGPSETACVGALKSSGADPSPRVLGMANDEGMAYPAQGGAFNWIVTRERDTANQETHSHSICAMHLWDRILRACGLSAKITSQTLTSFL